MGISSSRSRRVSDERSARHTLRRRRLAAQWVARGKNQSLQAARGYAARVGAGWMLHWRVARQVVFMARVFPTCTKSAVAQRSRRIGGEEEGASCEGGEGRREPISNSLLSVSVHRADWVERKEGSGYGRGNRCDHLHQWRIRISREKRIGKKNYHPSDSPPFYPLARSLYLVPCRLSSFESLQMGYWHLQHGRLCKEAPLIT